MDTKQIVNALNDALEAQFKSAGKIRRMIDHCQDECNHVWIDDPKNTRPDDDGLSQYCDVCGRGRTYAYREM